MARLCGLEGAVKSKGKSTHRKSSDSASSEYLCMYSIDRFRRSSPTVPYSVVTTQLLYLAGYHNQTAMFTFGFTC